MSNGNAENTSKYEEEIKIILVGESGTGKTSLISSVQGLTFYEGTQLSTVISSFIKLSIKISEKDYCINLWDTIGQERYRSLTNIFLNGSKIVIFVFDITNEESFNELDFWFKLIKDELGKNVIKGIAANKYDLIDEQKIDEDTIDEYAKKKGVPFAFTTATDIKTFSVFLKKLIKKYLEKEKNNDEPVDNKGKKLGDNLQKDNSTNTKCC